MKVRSITPILNVSDLQRSFAWFEKLGWRKGWDWGEPPTFGAVYNGDDIQIFLCVDHQGGRGRGDNAATFGPHGDESADRGVWLSIWVDDVDAAHRRCVDAGLDVTFEPADMPWGVREMHVRHPDGHVFRVSRAVAGQA